jgi:hypothetical protein
LAGSQYELTAGVRLVNHSHYRFPVLQIATALNWSDGISKVSQIHIFNCLIREEFTVPLVQYRWYSNRMCLWGNSGMILTGETAVLGEKHYTAWVVDE